MPTDRDMPASWSANARRGQVPLGAAVERAREARATALAPPRSDELASRRAARRAAEEARRKATTFQPPTGPQAC
jgi:hypothetical protein